MRFSNFGIMLLSGMAVLAFHDRAAVSGICLCIAALIVCIFTVGGKEAE